MRACALAAILFFGATFTQPATGQVMNRCGWFVNPTPGNAWLIDRDGQWIVGVQGGHQAEGDWPDFPERQWIQTNRSYGYGCACLKVIANPESKQVERIAGSTVRSLQVCRQDRTLKKPDL